MKEGKYKKVIFKEEVCECCGETTLGSERITQKQARKELGKDDFQELKKSGSFEGDESYYYIGEVRNKN